MTDTPEKTPAYPGRDKLNTAQAHFRRSCARLFEEAHRHDPALLPQLSAIVLEAAAHLDRLAAAATAAESSSTRNRAQLAAAEEKMRRTVRAGARRGDPRALALMDRLNERAGRDDA
ncbi:hypothetical protein [Streptomyces globosus]|uniref:hypothetical protein n=1 Tax=Streptomyces globosus TaxID=68209 RepID=UPI0031CF01FF